MMQRDVNIYKIKVCDKNPELEIIPGFIRHNDENDTDEVIYSVGPNDYVVYHPYFFMSDLNRVFFWGSCIAEGDTVTLIADKDSDRRSDIKKIHEFCFKQHGLILDQAKKLLRGMRACAMFDRGTKE